MNEMYQEDGMDIVYVVLLSILGTLLTIIFVSCLLWCICTKCCGRRLKIACELVQIADVKRNNVASGSISDDMLDRTSRQSSELRPLGMPLRNPCFLPDIDTPSLNSMSVRADFEGASSGAFKTLGGVLGDVSHGDVAHVHENGEEFQNEDDLTFDGIVRSPVGAAPRDNSEQSSAITVFQTDMELKEFTSRTDMSRSETIVVGGKLLVFISREVNHAGDTLVLNKMGISLSIPPNAIEYGRREVISLVLDWDLDDFPQMKDDESIIGPVVHCGPHGLRLNKPAILSYKHCAYKLHDVSVVTSETNLMEDKEWVVLGDRGDNTIFDLLESEIQIQISHFSLYTCLAERKPTEDAPETPSKKWMQIAVFGGKMKVKQHYEIRVYFLNNTPCALQFAIQNEANNHFKKLCPEKRFLFHGDGSDILAAIQHVSEGWSYRLEDTQECVPFLSPWHGKCPHVSFTFKHENENVRDIDIKLVVNQRGREHLETDKTNLKIVASMKSRHRSNSKTVINVYPPDTKGKGRRCDSVSSVKSSASISSTDSSNSSSSSTSTFSSSSNSSDLSSNFTSNVTPDKPSEQTTQIHIHNNENPWSCTGTPRTINHALCMELVVCLDPLSPLGNDWRVLASALNLDSIIPLLKDRPTYNPTETLLAEVERQSKSLDWLANVLFEARRLDAANIVMKYTNKNNACAQNEL